jgi:glutamate 5-kinase
MADPPLSQTAAKAALLRRPRRVVVKIGSSVLTRADGLAREEIERLAGEIAALHASGQCLTVVTSGAIAAGRAVLGIDAPRTIPERQAAAAVGQIALMAEYQRAFERFDVQVAQILLDADDLASRRRYLNAAHTMASLHASRIIPVVNENDTVAVDELKFGDNDNLSALVANLVGADLLVILSDVDGLFTANPRERSDAKRISVAPRIDAALLALASGRGSRAGTGGMSSKLLAARKAAAAGIVTVIANGRLAGTLQRVLDVGEDVGTLIVPVSDRLARRKHWIAFTVKPSGALTCDAGAVAAVRLRGRSLLPSGVVSVAGKFEAGDCVRLVGPDGEEFGRGLTSYNAAEAARIAGKKSSEVEHLLGYKMGDAIVHRNDLVLTGGEARPKSKAVRH